MEKFRKNFMNLHVGHWVLLLIILGSPSMVQGMGGNPDEKFETIKSELPEKFIIFIIAFPCS